MNDMAWMFTIYLTGLSVYGFVLMGMDKSKAKQGRRRISERRLLGIAAIGGSLGVWLGMRLFRHKTLHAKFRYGVPAIFAAQLVLAYWLITNFL